MSVPTDEIPQETQDEVRHALRHGVFGRLPESIRDRLTRTLSREGLSQPRTRIFFQLLDPMPGRSRFAELTEEQQTRLIDTLYATPEPAIAESMRRTVDAIVAARLSSSVQDTAVDVAAAPTIVYSTLPETERWLASWWLSRGYRYRTGAVPTILRHQAFGQLDDAQRKQLFTVLAHMHSDGADALLHLLEQGSGRLHPSGGDAHTRLLLSRDARGDTLLESLHRLAVGTPHASIGIGLRTVCRDVPPAPPRARPRGAPREEPEIIGIHGDDPTSKLPALVRARALADLVGEVAWPDQSINQDDRWTCQVTCILHRLARIQPAEYARLATDLILGASTTLRNGDAAVPPDDALDFDISTRSTSERLLQSAMMAYARSGERVHGRPIGYRNVRRTGDAADGFTDGRAGLFALPVTKVFNAVLPCTPVRTVVGRSASVQRVLAHFELRPDDPMIVGVNGHVIDLLHIVKPVASRATMRPVDGRRDPPPEPGVYYWNPWGAAFVIEDEGHVVVVHAGTVEPEGTSTTGAWVRRQTLDDRSSVQHMSWRTFSRYVSDIQQPTDEP